MRRNPYAHLKLTPEEIEAIARAIQIRPVPARSIYDRIWGPDEHEAEYWEQLSNGDKY